LEKKLLHIYEAQLGDQAIEDDIDCTLFNPIPSTIQNGGSSKF
jgi:hypothetical protein